jgi:hypothetical protein
MAMPCPHCGYLVALIVSQHGQVAHCPRCDGALRFESPQPGSSVEGDTAGRGALGEPMADTEADRGQIESASDALVAPVASAADAADIDASGAGRNAGASTPLPAIPVATAPAAASKRTRRPPSFVRGITPARKSRLAWPWHLAIVALCLLLGVQLLLAQRHELAASARWRPWVAGLCDALSCEIPAWREPRAFTMLDRSVQPDPAMPGVLAVEANFRNDARWPQPWPTLVLSLSDVEGREVGLRVFAPSEYRGTAAGDELLAPGQSGTVRLQVREPSPRIVAFTFDFL